jgi:ATP-binding cassette subfamily B protein
MTTTRRLDVVLWPKTRVGEALFVLGAHTRLPVAGMEQHSPAPDLDGPELSTWIEIEAERGGCSAEPRCVPLGGIVQLFQRGTPALVQIRALPGEPFIAVTASQGAWLTAIGPDRRLHRIPVDEVAAAIRLEFEAPVSVAIDRSLDAMGLTGAKRERVRTALLQERLAAIRFRACWTLRLPAGAPIAALAREARVGQRLSIVVGAHVAQYTLWLMSWWLLGRGALTGTLDMGWLLGWMLLLGSLVPFRLLGTLTQGRALVAIGALLRRRLLHGGLRLDPQTVKHQGAGHLFSLVVEGSALDSTMLTGGLQALFAFIELTIAIAILSFAAASPTAALVLTAWIAGAGFATWRYVRYRRSWTRERLQLTHQLLESIVGHRTRAIQQVPDRMHAGEDEMLERYLETAARMDRVSAWLTAVMPRGWLLAGLCVLALDIVPGGATTAAVTMTVVGLLLGYRALRRLSVGITGLADAAIAWHTVAPLEKAAARADSLSVAPSPVTMRAGGASCSTAVDVRDVTFRYREHGEPVLHNCSLRVRRGANVLIEGPSGSGKSTLASLIAGLRRPAAGAVLIDGVDRSVTHPSTWRQRVLLTPQSHDNYLISGSLAFNLLMGRQWPPLESDFAEAEEICRELGLGDLLDRMPSRLNQQVGETGWQLSQGERTRVYLARALLQRAGVLVLDETFSALDPENIDRVIRCVQRRTPTVLAIAHT